MLKTLANFPTPQLGSLVHVHILQRLEACSKSLRIILVMYIYQPRPAATPRFCLAAVEKTCHSCETKFGSGLGTRLHTYQCKEASMLVQIRVQLLVRRQSVDCNTEKKKKKKTAHFHFCNFQISQSSPQTHPARKLSQPRSQAFPGSSF